LHANYGRPALIVVAFRAAPSIDVSATCLLFVGSVMVSKFFFFSSVMLMRTIRTL